MKAQVVFGLSVLALGGRAATLSARSGVRKGGCDSVSHAYDFELLVQQWPRDFGIGHDYTTLHGMWPSRDGTSGTADSYPCTCTQEAFDASQIESIMPDMDKYWPSLEGSGVTFWAHEWGKHGTCTGQSQLSFFSSTLDARKKYDGYAALTKAGLSEGNAYPATAYDAAFMKAYGAPAELGCDSQNGIREISFCLTKFPALAAIACAATVTNTHGETTSCDRTQDIMFVMDAPPPAPPHPPGPPGPPGPPATTCQPGKRGPPCKADADCKTVPNCVRCAHSGFCTEEPTNEPLFSTL